MNKNLFKFVHRTASNTSDKRIADAYKAYGFDVDLVTSDEKKVSAHRFVLALYSKYLATQIYDTGCNGTLIIPLNNLPFEIVQKVVQLMYFREVTVPEDLSTKMTEALKFLKVDDTNVTKCEEEIFKKPHAPSAAAQRKIVSAQKPAAGAPIQQQRPPQQQQQQQQKQPQPKTTRVENASKNEQIESYVPGKRKRAQSTFVSGSARDPDLFVASQIPNGGDNQSVSTMNLAQKYPSLNISKMPRTQLQPPKVAGSQPINTNPQPMEMPESIASQSTVSNPSLVQKSNVGAMMQTPEKSTTTSNIQPQQQARSTQPHMIPNVSPSITIHKVTPTAEKSNIIQNDDKSKQSDDNEQLSDLFVASQTPNGGGGDNQSVSTMRFAQKYPHLNISKVPRTQPQPPKVVGSQPTNANTQPMVKLDVDPIMEMPESIASRSTGANLSLVTKSNVGAMMQTPEKSTTTHNIQPQQPDDNAEFSNEMEKDEDSQFDDIVMDSDEEEEELVVENKRDGNNNDATDLRDIFPELRDAETQ